MQLREIPYRANQFLRKKIDKNFASNNFSYLFNGNFSENIWENFDNQNGNALRLNEINSKEET